MLESQLWGALSGLFFFILHVTGTGSFPRALRPAQEQACLKRLMEGDAAARDELIAHNLRLVAHIIKKYYAGAADQEDLISIGTIGLIKAVNTFDPKKGIRLSSYAARCIENAMRTRGRGRSPSVSFLAVLYLIEKEKKRGETAERTCDTMPMLGAILTPHPPVLLPEVGRGRERAIAATGQAMQAAAAEVAAWKPDVLIVSSPHTILYGDYFHISPGKGASGDMAAFGAPQVRLTVRYDAPLREEIVRRAEKAGLQAGTRGQRDPWLDHGVVIPLSFLRKAGVDCPIVRLGLSGFSALSHYRLGQCAAEAVNALGRRAVFVASGDLSHKLKEDGPYGFAPEGPVFDEAVTEAIQSGDFLKLLTMEPSLCERAAECGLRSFQIMAGALDGLAVKPRLLSHEGTFGVGYAVALLPVTGTDSRRRFAAACEQAQRERLAKRRAQEDPWVRLARLALETYVRTGRRLERLPGDLPGELTGRAAGTFVSLHRDGRLRGCIGTIAPTEENAAWEIVRNAVSAGTHDPRFPPVRPEELDELEYSVDVLGAPEPVEWPGQLDPKRYGVIVSCGGRRGLLLPDLDGVDTAEAQLQIARRKGGIRADEPYTIERFQVVRHL